MGLSVGDEISCDDLKEKENLFWKSSYGEEAWKKEKVRITLASKNKQRKKSHKNYLAQNYGLITLTIIGITFG